MRALADSTPIDQPVRVEISAATLRHWLAEGMIGAGELRCLDADSKRCVRALCLQNVREALADRRLHNICTACAACEKGPVKTLEPGAIQPVDAPTKI